MNLKRFKQVAIVAAFLFGLEMAQTTVNAAVHDQGPDWSKYQSTRGQYGTNNDKFAIVQLGGTYGGTYIDQSTYHSQVQAALSAGNRAHTYIWYGVGNSTQLGIEALQRFIPRVETPKGSIVALDYEDGATANVEGNTDAILAGMRYIKEQGYTPMYYSYKPYTLAHVDYKRIIAEFPNSLWIAAYPDYLVRTSPYWGVFPSMDGVAMYQFTSTYAAGGLDGNIDLTGITDNGYTKNTNPTDTPAPKPTNTNDLTVDGYFGPATWKKLEAYFGITQDGVISGQYSGNKKYMAYNHNGIQYTSTHRGSLTIKVLQRKLGVTPDGILGRDTIKALQRYLGTPIDGVVSPHSRMVMELQRRLNAGTF